MRPDFLAYHKQGRVLLGTCNETAVFGVNGTQSFMDGLVQDASLEEVVAEIERRIRKAKELGFGDVIVLWPRQHFRTATGGMETMRTVDHRDLPLERLAGICGKTGTYFALHYAEGNIRMNPARVKKLQRESGGRFLGECLGEVGGRTWYSAARAARLKQHQENAKPGAITHKLDARDMRGAKRNYVDFIRRRTTKWRRMGCHGNFPVDGTAMHKYNLEGGIDFAGAELIERFARSLALTRGASRSHGKDFWCSYIPLAHYLGWPHNTPAKLGRWKVALNQSLMMGAGMIIEESGVFSTQMWTPNMPRFRGVYSSKDPFCGKATQIFRDFARFTARHRRPPGHPRSLIAVVQGHLDGWNGTPPSSRQRVWAQHGQGDHWKLGPAEESWSHLDNVFYPGGKWLSGTPYGQVDIISSDAPVSVMNEHKLLVFLGWNTMTRGLLTKLRRYVRSGGTLLVCLPHLSVSADRGSDLEMIGPAFQRDMLGLEILKKTARVHEITLTKARSLPGMRRRYAMRGNPVRVPAVKLRGAEPIAVSGTRPVLVRHGLGRGSVYLSLCRNYPAESGLQHFFSDLLKTLSSQALQQQELRVDGSPYLNYAVYDQDDTGAKMLYLLEYNPRHDEYPAETGMSAKRAAEARGTRKAIITIGGTKHQVTLRPNALKTVRVADGTVLTG